MSRAPTKQEVAARVADYLEGHVRYAEMTKREVALEAVRVTLEEACHETRQIVAADLLAGTKPADIRRALIEEAGKR